MSEAEFMSKNPDSKNTSDRARSDQKKNNLSKSNNNETHVKTEPMNPNENAFYSPEQHELISHGDVQ